jgi:hypothetical protein
MAKVIFKYAIRDYGLTVIPLPDGAEVLTCQQQGAGFVLWASVNLRADIELRRFYSRPTGETFCEEPGARYIATVETVSGYFAHIYDVTDVKNGAPYA